MTRFSANLGFLWADKPLPEAIHMAKSAGFDAVECHWPYDTSAEDTKAALEETGLKMLGLNTSRGNVLAGENGLSALPGRENEARAAIEEAISYALAVNAAKVHVMAGFASGEDAHQTFVENLRYACKSAEPHNINILIEPLNKYDAPGYFLTTTDLAIAIIREVSADNLQLMFDCYHVQIMEGDLSNKLEMLMGDIGHIQFASVPGRDRPDLGEINYSWIFEVIAKLGYDAPLGAEYKPKNGTDESLGWLRDF